MSSLSGHSSSEKVTKFTNKLIEEKSPYLLQHAHNPVKWYPWGDEAIEIARKENKLIFLSVGYSTCHWCHVMENESFEDVSVATILNEHYVSIKVDREERPDIDKIYMTFIQATSGRGGWPMSVFLTPDLHPVAGGTYFPRDDRWGRPGFKTILSDLADKWNSQPQDFISSGNHIMEVLKKFSEVTIDSIPEIKLPGSVCWKTCIDRYLRTFDKEFGGFGGAPKFPQVSNLDFLFHYYARTKNSIDGKKCLEVCLHTLKKMAHGGIHDHISKGFARYSVDEKWHVPHFEKMLYDQALLCMTYVDAFLASKDKFYIDIASEILDYVTRDLSHESGGFYSAEDADSFPNYESKEKKEGAFCVWEKKEIDALLADKFIPGECTKSGTSISFVDVFCFHFNIGTEGNVDYTSDPHGELSKTNVLIVLGSSEATADKFGISLEKLNSVLEECKTILYDKRQQRPRPHLDTKMVCSWNGLMIAAFSKVGLALNNATYVNRAIQAANFIKENLYNKDEGILYRACYKGEDGKVCQLSHPIKGFLDDYAFLIKGLLDLYEVSMNREWLWWALDLQNKQDELFWDEKNYGYFSSSVGDSSVILRLKEEVDGAEPSGNSVSVHNLLRFSALSLGGKDCRRDRAEQILSAFGPRMLEAPTSLPYMVSGLMFFLDSPTQVFIAGYRDDPLTLELIDVVRSRLLPGRVLAVAEPSESSESSEDKSIVKEKALENIHTIGGKSAAYVCRHYTCNLPVTDPKKLAELLDKNLGEYV